MAVVLTGTQRWTRAAFFGNAANDFTFMAWVTISALPVGASTYQHIGGMSGAISVGVSSHSGTAKWVIEHPIADSDGTTLPAIDTPYHVCLTRRGSDERVYINGVPEIVVTNAEVGATGLVIGDYDGTGGNQWLGQVWGVKAWDGAVLLIDQIRREAVQAAPVRHSGYAYPFKDPTAELQERVYGGRPLTKTGTVTYSDRLLPWSVPKLRIWDVPAAAAGGAFKAAWAVGANRLLSGGCAS